MHCSGIISEMFGILWGCTPTVNQFYYHIRVTLEMTPLLSIISCAGVNDLMPHKVQCPSSVEEFDNMTVQYVRSAADLRELISRILVWSSVHLPGKEGADNKGIKLRCFHCFCLTVLLTSHAFSVFFSFG